MSDLGRGFGLLLAAGLLAGCAAPPLAVPPSPFSLVPATGGLAVAGSGGREIGFGRDRDGALASAARVTGQAAETVACAGGRDGVRVGGGLTMVFTGKTFTGWETETGSAGTPCARA